MTPERLRELVADAEHGRQDTTNVVVAAAQRAVARERLGELAPDLALLVADCADFLADLDPTELHHRSWDHLARLNQRFADLGAA